MGAMSPKFNSLTVHAAQVQASMLASVIPLMNTPADGMNANIYGDVRTKVIPFAEVAVGDKAYAGNIFGTVTAILNDGEDPAVNNRIQVTYETKFMQTPNADSVSDRIVEYSFIDNDEADADGTTKIENPNALSGLGVIFVRVL